MSRPYSEDIRERALARADAGETVRSIAAALQISPSCVPKWKNLRRTTGGVSPGKIGGHKTPVLSGANADWLRARIRSANIGHRGGSCAMASAASFSVAGADIVLTVRKVMTVLLIPEISRDRP